MTNPCSPSLWLFCTCSSTQKGLGNIPFKSFVACDKLTSLALHSLRHSFDFVSILYPSSLSQTQFGLPDSQIYFQSKKYFLQSILPLMVPQCECLRYLSEHSATDKPFSSASSQSIAREFDHFYFSFCFFLKSLS